MMTCYNTQGAHQIHLVLVTVAVCDGIEAIQLVLNLLQEMSN